MTHAPTQAQPAAAALGMPGALIYRFEAQLGELRPIGLFPDGIRFHNAFEGAVVAGPFAGAHISGLDRFLLRPDGVGEIVAPEYIEIDGTRVAGWVRGYVVPPPGLEMPPLEVILRPGFEFPDLDFRVTASVLLETADPRYAELNRTVALVEGTANLASGRLTIEARAA